MIKKLHMKESTDNNFGVEIDNSMSYYAVRENMQQYYAKYYVMLKKHPSLGNDAYMFKYINNFSDATGYWFCTHDGKLIDQDNRGLPIHKFYGADKILPKIFPKNFTPNVLYAIWTNNSYSDTPQFATVSPMWSHLSGYFK